MIDFFEFSLKKFKSKNETPWNILAKIVENLYYLLGILINVTNSAETVSILFHQCSKNGLKILVNLLTNEIKDFGLGEKEKYFLYEGCILSCLNNLSIVAYKFKPMWIELGDISMYYEWSNKFSKIDTKGKILPFFVIARIASDENLKNMSKDDIGNIIQEIVLKIKSLSGMLKNQKNFERTNMYLEQKLENIINDDDGFNLNEVIISFVL